MHFQTFRFWIHARVLRQGSERRWTDGQTDRRTEFPDSELLNCCITVLKNQTFFFSVQGGTVFGGPNVGRPFGFFGFWCRSGVPCPVWTPSHECKNGMFENACTIRGLIEKTKLFFFCPWWDGFWDVRTFSDKLFRPGKKNDHFSTFLEKKKFLKNCFLSMIPAPKCTER